MKMLHLRLLLLMLISLSKLTISITSDFDIDTEQKLPEHTTELILNIKNSKLLNDTIPNKIQNNANRLNNGNINIKNNTQTENELQNVTFRLMENLPIVNNYNLKRSPSIKLYNKTDMLLRKRKIEKKPYVINVADLKEWKCPNISQNRNVECGCDIPHTLRCSGNIHSLEQIANSLRKSKYSVSLLDCTLKNVTFINDAKIFENISLHGLVISSGEIKRIHRSAFFGLKGQLQALGLPNNALVNVPWNSFSPLTSLERLDLSNNNIKVIGTVEFKNLPNLTYLELSENQISRITMLTFLSQKKLITLNLGGNRIGDFPENFKSIEVCTNLRELDLKSNAIKDDITNETLPILPLLESLNLDRNLLTCIRNNSFQYYPKLLTLSLNHNSIDVLEELAFIGLKSLQQLNLAYNGIVAISGTSLRYVPHLLVLDLKHNFLRALTSDLIVPLPFLNVLRLDGNDISIISKTALDTASELYSLSLQDNPLSCDCTLKSFAEWLVASKISSIDVLGAICATPRHLEGAPLVQIPPSSLNCDDNDNIYENANANVIQQLDANIQQINNTIQDYSDVIILKQLHLSTDYGLILTWGINLKNDEYTCDAVFVYKEANRHEILLDNSPIHCEAKTINNENIVSVIIRDLAGLQIGDCYRFCLVLIQEKNIKRDLVIGCSNITKLEPYEKLTGYSNNDNDNDNNKITNLTDISTIEKISIYNEEINFNDYNYKNPNIKQNNEHNNSNNNNNNNNNNNVNEIINSANLASTSTNNNNQQFEYVEIIQLFVFCVSAFIIISFGFWFSIKYRTYKVPNPTVTTCYTATSDQLTNIHNENDNRNKYLKLQATTSL